MANEPLDAKTLAELLKQHEDEKKAMREEFEDSSSDNATVTTENAKRRVAELAPDAWAAVNYLVNHAESESVRANCAKWILDITMGKKQVAGDKDDSIENLIESLRPKNAT
jgi:sarcosine oxidase gamma subunit